MSVFVNNKFLINQLRPTNISDRGIWDSIAIVVALNLFNNNFKAKTANMLKCKDKTIKEIEQMLASTKAKLITKWAMRLMKNLPIAYEERSSGKG